jgi:hypothetical protein
VPRLIRLVRLVRSHLDAPSIRGDRSHFVFMQPAQRLEGEPGCIAPSISSLFTGPETPTELPGPYEQEVTTVYLYVLILGAPVKVFVLRQTVVPLSRRVLL